MTRGAFWSKNGPPKLYSSIPFQNESRAIEVVSCHWFLSENAFVAHAAEEAKFITFKPLGLLVCALAPFGRTFFEVVFYMQPACGEHEKQQPGQGCKCAQTTALFLMLKQGSKHLNFDLSPNSWVSCIAQIS